MNRNKLTELINRPQEVTGKDAALLADMAAQYPYATAIRVLLAKSHQKKDTARQQLGIAALYTPNRRVLRLLMEDKLLSSPLADATLTSAPAQASPQEQRPDPSSDPVPITPAADASLSQGRAGSKAQPAPDAFEELQENLRKLRELRSKSSKPDAAADKQPPTPENQSISVGSLSEAVQQIVEDHEEQQVDNPRIQLQRNLIDSFLINAPSLQRRQLQQTDAETSVPDLSQNIESTPQDLATETLAKIMERQGKTEKAIDIYQKLILKYPQKSAYFADCIEKLKQN